MKLATKIAYNTIIQIIGKIISTALGLVSVGMITRYLGTTGFGEYTTILTFISFFAIIADLGLTLVTVQLISQPNCDEKRILGNLLGLRLISALFFIGLAPITVFFFPYSSAIKIGVVIASLSFFFVAQNQILVGLFQKRLRMDKVSIAEVVNRLALVGMVIFVIRANYGLNGVIIATVIASFINFLLHYIFSRQFVKIKLQFDLKYWQEIVKKTWPLAVTIVFNLIYLKTDTLLLSIIKRKSEIGIIAEVGLYGAAYKVIDVLITFPFIFAGIVLPVMTAAWANKNKEEFKKILQKAFDVMALIAIPLAIGTQLLATQVITLVMGKEFAMAGPILQILILAASIIFLGNMFAHAVIAIDKQREIISAYIFVAITSVIGYLIFIPQYSYFGAAYVTIYSELAISLASFLLVYKNTKFIPRMEVLYKSILASLVMLASIYLTYLFISHNLFIVLAIAIITYFIFLIIFRGLKKKDLLVLINK
jgi:O-antigen/teichoic acid export membrane protein